MSVGSGEREVLKALRECRMQKRVDEATKLKDLVGETILFNSPYLGSPSGHIVEGKVVDSFEGARGRTMYKINLTNGSGAEVSHNYLEDEGEAKIVTGKKRLAKLKVGDKVRFKDPKSKSQIDGEIVSRDKAKMSDLIIYTIQHKNGEIKVPHESLEFADVKVS